jgi:hypothetical protein
VAKPIGARSAQRSQFQDEVAVVEPTDTFDEDARAELNWQILVPVNGGGSVGAA